MPFIFDPSERGRLAEASIGHTTLERRPVAWRDDDFFLILPTAVSAAIRRFVIDQVSAVGMRDVFVAALAKEYATHFEKYLSSAVFSALQLGFAELRMESLPRPDFKSIAAGISMSSSSSTPWKDSTKTP
jgi:hypothetical protein